jgi:ribosomal protein S18 acetylase RimI-like enzyme
MHLPNLEVAEERHCWWSPHIERFPESTKGVIPLAEVTMVECHLESEIRRLGIGRNLFEELLKRFIEDVLTIAAIPNRHHSKAVKRRGGNRR